MVRVLSLSGDLNQLLSLVACARCVKQAFAAVARTVSKRSEKKWAPCYNAAMPATAFFPAMRTLLTAIVIACPLAAQLPDLYRSVDRVTWVVDNIDRAVLGWEKVGLIQIEQRSDAELAITFRGKQTTAKVR